MCKNRGALRARHEGQSVVQGISESTARALQLAEQRLAEAAAELQRRASALRDVTSERNTALAEVSPVRAGFLGCTESGNALRCVVCQLYTLCTVPTRDSAALSFRVYKAPLRCEDG